MRQAVPSMEQFRELRKNAVTPNMTCPFRCYRILSSRRKMQSLTFQQLSLVSASKRTLTA
jgi:hypothetical protein